MYPAITLIEHDKQSDYMRVSVLLVSHYALSHLNVNMILFT